MWSAPTQATPSAGPTAAAPLASTLRLPTTWLYIIAARAGLAVIPVGLIAAGILLGAVYELLARAQPVAVSIATPAAAIEIA